MAATISNDDLRVQPTLAPVPMYIPKDSVKVYRKLVAHRMFITTDAVLTVEVFHVSIYCRKRHLKSLLNLRTLISK
jgi:hypothetical protein